MFLSTLDEEDWRKKNPKSKIVSTSRRAIQSILNPTVAATKSIILLKNGHLSIGETSIQTIFTCPFDSLYAIIAAMYADFEEIKNKIDQHQPGCQFSGMVTLMFNNEKSLAVKQNSLLRQRNKILKNIFEGSERITKFGSGLCSINCSANVNYIIPKALPGNLYSYTRKKHCLQCHDELVSNRCFVDINMENFARKTIQNLNECVLDTLISERSSTCPCGGLRKVTHTEFSSFIMIDLHLEDRIRETTLKEIPQTMNILGVGFAIFGCIEFIGDDSEVLNVDDQIGHYVSHIFRNNKRWERYDDMHSKITTSDTNGKLKAQILFYIKQK